MKITRGTPKTLKQAIVNGINDSPGNGEDAEQLAEHILPHVIDYLAQKFSVAYLKIGGDAIKQLYERITGKNTDVKENMNGLHPMPQSSNPPPSYL